MYPIHQILRQTSLVAGLALLALLSGLAVIPGETMIPQHRQVVSRHHYYGTPKTPELDSGRVLGIPKVNPKWWIENSDEPLPWWWKYGEPTDERKRTWLMRNPFHNFTSYVIGVADRHTHRIGINAHSIWNDKGPINLAVTRAGLLDLFADDQRSRALVGRLHRLAHIREFRRGVASGSARFRRHGASGHKPACQGDGRESTRRRGSQSHAQSPSE